MSTITDAIKKALKGVKKSKNKRFFASYLYRRIPHLHAEHAGWTVAQLATQVASERTTIEDYISEKQESIIIGPDPTQPAHLDLDLAALIRASTSAKLRETIHDEYRQRRQESIKQIVWRAFAIHHEALWKAPPDPGFEELALDELLDYRLRAVEQMQCNVVAANRTPSTSERSWTVDGATSGWRDGFLVRNFEYANLPKKPFEAILPLTDWVEAGGIITYRPNNGTGPPVRFPASVQDAWLINFPWAIYQPDPGHIPADIVSAMFEPPRGDFLERSWLFCDAMGALVNLEALRFALRRRTGSDVIFNQVLTLENYVKIGPVLSFRTHDRGILMADPDDDIFENRNVSLDDLQVGDHVCFWNSRLYDLLLDGAFRNEYCHVMSIDVSEKTGKVLTSSDGPSIELAGHGVNTSSYGAMANTLVQQVTIMINAARAVVVKELQTNPAAVVVIWAGATLKRWEPFEAFDSPGAWWIEIERAIWENGWGYTDLADAVAGNPGTIEGVYGIGADGYNLPSGSDGQEIYFPLYESAVGQTAGDLNSWRAYLDQRIADPEYRAPTGLRAYVVDGKYTPGLFRRPGAEIPVVRPRVRL